jgi:uncharacterized protein (TIGR00369 family)
VAVSADTSPWQEPPRGSYPDMSLLARAGIEQMRTIIDDAIVPPIGRLTGMALTDVGLASATFSMPASRWLASPQGLISVGTLAILADGPLGCAVHSALEPQIAYATSELSLRLLRPAHPGGTLIARGRLIHAGRSLALSAVQIVDERGRLLADGSSLCFLRSLRGLMPSEPPAEPEPQPEAAPAAPATPDPYERPDILGATVGAEVYMGRSGLEILEAHIAGELPAPPIHHLTGLRLVAASAGEATFVLPCHEWLCSPLRTVEGGTIALVADSALVSAIQTTVPAGTAVAAIDLKVNFLRPVMPDGRELRAVGRVRHAGRTIAVAEADVLDADGKAVAVATGSAMLRRGGAGA